MLHLDEKSVLSGLTDLAAGKSHRRAGRAQGPAPIAGGGPRTAAILLGTFLLLAGGAILGRSAFDDVSPWSSADAGTRPGFESVTGNLDFVMSPAGQVAPRILRTALDSGGNLTASLGALGVPPEARAGIIDSIRRYVNPRRLPSGTGLSAIVDESGVPTAVALRTEPERFLRLTLPTVDSPAVRSELIRLPVVTSLETLGGVVQTSVAQAFSHSPHGSQLTDAFADVFQWDVDLLIETRPGDAVRVVYEAQRLGEPPADLPALSGAPLAAGDFLQVGRILAARYEGTIARSAGFWIEGPAGTGGYYDDDGRPLRKTFLKSPLNYRRISSGFSSARRNPVTRRVVPHHGVDFAADTGTPVVATADGRVTSAGWNGPLGKAVRLQHGSVFSTIYGHLSGFAPGIRAGVEVRQNQVLGYVGSTGRATGPHLHYTMVRAGRAINPMTFENPAADPLATEAAWRLDEAKQRWLPVLMAIAVDAATDEYELARQEPTSGPIIRPGT